MELGEVYVKIGADTKPLSAGLAQARGQVKKTTEQMRAQMKTLGTGMVIAGAAITAAFALTVKSAINFQKQLAQVSTMLDESAMKIMPQYKSELLKMSAAFGESTDTLSKGLYDILSASIPPAQALDVLAVAATAATAGVTNTGVAADAITTILNSYGFSADKAGEVSDKLFAIVKRGKLTFDELAPAIGKVASLAAKTGLSFDELGAMIATLTRAGIRTDEAMTSINGVLRAFLKPSDEAKKAAEAFGLTMDTTTIKTIGLKGAMDKLRDATAEQLAEIFPNIRGLKGLIAALGDAEGYAKDYELMLNSAGLTQIAFAKQSATLGFKIDQLKKSFNVIAVTVGDVLIPVIQSVVERVGKLVFTMKEWMDKHPGLIKAIVLLGAAFGVFTMAGGLLILGALYFTKLSTTMTGVTGALKLMIPKMMAFRTVSVMTNTTIAQGVLPLLSGLRIALNTVGVAVLAAAANVMIWSEVWREWQKVADSVHTSLQDVNDAQAITLKMQEEAAKKFGVTLEVFQEWQKSGKAISEISEDVAAVMDKLAAKKLFEEQIKELAEFEEKIRSMEAELSAMTIGSKQWQLLSQEIAATKEEMKDLGDAMSKLALAEGIVENAKIIKTTVADITLDIDLLAKRFEVTGKSVEESATYYGTLIEKLNAVDVILQTELMLLEEGTKAYKEKQAEILENAKAIGEIEENLKKLIEPLEGLELIAAKMALLGDSTEDTKAKIELLSEKAVLLQQALDEAIPDTEAWWEAKLAFEGNQVAIDGLKEKLSELTEEEKEAIVHAEKLADAYKSITDKIYELTHTPMETAIRKLDEQKEKYLEMGVAIEKVNEWYGLQIKKLQELNPELDETTKKLKEAGEVAEDIGILGGESFKGFTTQIKHATTALSNFTKEAVAAAITQIKMHFHPIIMGLMEDINNMTGIWREMAQHQLERMRKNMQEQINLIMYGMETYNQELNKLGGANEDLATATVGATNSMISSWNSITNTIEETTDAVNDMANAFSNAINIGSSQVSGGGGGGGFFGTGGGSLEQPPYVPPTYIPRFQMGTPFVPKTGLAIVHKGEEINPSGQRSYDQRSFSPTININNPIVRNDNDIYEIRKVVEQALNENNNQYYRRPNELVPGIG